jgi:hypothetical protein
MTLLKSMMIQDKMLSIFMCEGKGGGDSYLAERQRKRKCERESLTERGAKIRTFSQTTNGNIIS